MLGKRLGDHKFVSINMLRTRPGYFEVEHFGSRRTGVSDQADQVYRREETMCSVGVSIYLR